MAAGQGGGRAFGTLARLRLRGGPALGRRVGREQESVRRAAAHNPCPRLHHLEHGPFCKATGFDTRTRASRLCLRPCMGAAFWRRGMLAAGCPCLSGRPRQPAAVPRAPTPAPGPGPRPRPGPICGMTRRADRSGDVDQAAPPPLAKNRDAGGQRREGKGVRDWVLGAADEWPGGRVYG